MNTRLIANLLRARILEAHRMKSLQRARPPCVPLIAQEKATLADIDARIRRETGMVAR
jgi:hypothetical protein